MVPRCREVLRSHVGHNVTNSAAMWEDFVGGASNRASREAKAVDKSRAQRSASMCENVEFFEACQIERGARGQEFEAAGGQLGAALPDQHHVELRH